MPQLAKPTSDVDIHFKTVGALKGRDLDVDPPAPSVNAVRRISRHRNQQVPVAGCIQPHENIPRLNLTTGRKQSKLLSRQTAGKFDIRLDTSPEIFQVVRGK